MTHLKPFIIFVFSLVGVQVSSAFADTCPDSHANVGPVSQCTVVGSRSSIQLNFITGFSSTSSTSPIDGNFGKTIGEQRRLAYIKAAEILAEHIHSPQVIEVNARFTDLECSSDSAVLGSAGAIGSVAFEESDGVAGIPLDTFFPIALANAIFDDDIFPNEADIEAEFNSQLGSLNCLSGVEWYYGFEEASGFDINFLSVLLHEITHGLGFASMVNPSSGAKPTDQFGTILDDIFSNFLYDDNLNETWDNLGNIERRASAIGDNLFWNGVKANQQAVGVLTAGYSNEESSGGFSLGDRIKMYAPSELELGSSVSHFDSRVTPNELMEPNLEDTTCTIGLAYGVLEDIGWDITYPTSGFQLNHRCRSLNSGNTLTSYQGDETIFIKPISDHAITEISLTYQGADKSEFITPVTGGYLISPPSGEFAGTYTLTIKNGVNADITITIERPLLVEWSAGALLQGVNYKLTVSGGAAGQVYDLSFDPSDVITVKNPLGDNIVSITATNDSELYNPASGSVSTDNVQAVTSVTGAVSSQSNTYNTVESKIEVYPSIEYNLTVVDSDSQRIANADIRLSNTTIVNLLGLETDYQTNSQGTLSLLLPDVDGTTFSISISKNGFSTRSFLLSNLQTTHTFSLNEIFNNVEDDDVIPKAKSSSGFGSMNLFWLLLFSFAAFRQRSSKLI